MHRGELTEQIAAKSALSKAAASRTLDALLENITARVAKREDVQTISFSTFNEVKRIARTGKNPRTGETLKIVSVSVEET